MSFISDIFKKLIMVRRVPNEGLLHYDKRGADKIHETEVSMFQKEVLVNEPLENGDEAVTETAAQKREDEKINKEETVGYEEKDEITARQEIEKPIPCSEDGSNILRKEFPQKELLEAVMPIKTTGSVGNFGKHFEISNEAGSMGGRLGRLASTKGEHYYFQ